MIYDALSNKKLNPVVTNLIIRDRKLNVSPVFITRSYFAVPKIIRLNFSHFFSMKFQTNENFNKLLLIIHQILTFRTLWIYIKTCTAKLFQLLMLLLYQIILYVSERIFWKEYKTNHENLMKRLDMRNYNIILTEKQQKCQHYRLIKLMNMINLQVKRNIVFQSKTNNRTS